jgi:hypothetical protein
MWLRGGRRRRGAKSSALGTGGFRMVLPLPLLLPPPKPMDDADDEEDEEEDEAVDNAENVRRCRLPADGCCGSSSSPISRRTRAWAPLAATRRSSAPRRRKAWFEGGKDDDEDEEEEEEDGDGVMSGLGCCLPGSASAWSSSRSALGGRRGSFCYI